MLVSLIE